LSLHHGWRDAARVPRRLTLLVAQDQRPHVSRRLGPIFGAGSFCGIQPDVLATVCARLYGHAATLSHLSGRPRVLAGSARVIYGGRIDTRCRFDDATDLSGLVDALWENRGSESVELAGTRMADGVAGPNTEFPDDADRDARGVRVCATGT